MQETPTLGESARRCLDTSGILRRRPRQLAKPRTDGRAPVSPRGAGPSFLSFFLSFFLPFLYSIGVSRESEMARVTS